MSHRRSDRPDRSDKSAVALAAFLLVAGLAHFAVPRSYERIVPRLLADPAFWVRWSGVAEIACAGLLAHPRTRRPAAFAAAALFVAVFPANVRMALDGGIAGKPFPLGSPAAAWARLPLQIPLILWACRVARASAADAGDGAVALVGHPHGPVHGGEGHR